jgi:predicted transcriptional regulator
MLKINKYMYVYIYFFKKNISLSMILNQMILERFQSENFNKNLETVIRVNFFY